jgi:hypothetical protein
MDEAVFSQMPCLGQLRKIGNSNWPAQSHDAISMGGEGGGWLHPSIGSGFPKGKKEKKSMLRPLKPHSHQSSLM